MAKLQTARMTSCKYLYLKCALLQEIILSPGIRKLKKVEINEKF